MSSLNSPQGDEVVRDVSKILVTGGAGFIGSNLVKKLVKLGFGVRVVDDMSKGSEKNLSDVLNRIELIVGDITHRPVVREAVEGVHGIVHLAAKVDVRKSVKQPFLYNEVNSTGTLNLLEASKGQLKKFVYASTCAVYGDPVRLPIDEGHPLCPLSPYAASKLSGENYCTAYSNHQARARGTRAAASGPAL